MGVNFEISKAHDRPGLFLPTDQVVDSQLLLQHLVNLHATSLSEVVIMY